MVATDPSSSQLFMTSPNSDRDEPFSWSDDDDSSDENRHSSQLSLAAAICFSCSGPIGSVVRSAVAHLLIALILLLPGICDYLLWGQDQVADGVSLTKIGTRVGGVTLIVWSLGLTFCYVLYLAIRLLVSLVPVTVLKVGQLVSGKVSTRTEIAMDYVTDLTTFVSLSIFAVTVVISFFAILRPDINYGGEEAWRPIIFDVLLTLMIVSILLLIQKFLVQLIAVKFHRTAYLDRIKRLKHSSNVMFILDTAAKRIHKEYQSYKQLVDANLRMRASSAGPNERKIKWKTDKGGAVEKRHISDTIGVKSPSQKQKDFSDALMTVESNSKIAEALDLAIPAQFEHRTRTNEILHNKEDFDHLANQNFDAKSSDMKSMEPNEHGLYPAEMSFMSAHSLITPLSETNSLHASNEILSPPGKKFSGWFSWNKRQKRDSDSDSRSFGFSFRLPSAQLSRLARDIGREMDVRSPREASKVSRRIYEALCLETRLYIEHARKLFRSDKQRGRKRLKTNNEEELLALERHEFMNTLTVEQKSELGSLTLDAFISIFPTRLDAEKAFAVFDSDMNGSLTKNELKTTVISIFKERKAVSASLRDMGSAVGKLDAIFSCITFALSVISGLLVFGVELQSFLVSSVSLLLAITFMVGNSAKNLFEGVIFLFVTHPFDVGDRVFIDNQNLIVKELGILTTIFQRFDGQIIYSPNAILATKLIHNIRRSANQMQVVEIHVDVDTPPETINSLKAKIGEWVHAEARDFVPRMELMPYEIENMNKLKFQIFLEHKGNWQDGEQRWNRHNRFYFFLHQALLDLGVKYFLPTQRINVLNLPSATKLL